MSKHRPADHDAQTLPPPLPTLQLAALVIGALGFIATIIGLLVQPDHAFRSYLWAYVVCLDVALGSLALCMITFLVGGEWGLLARRVFEAAASTLPLLAILFIPIAFGLPYLYEWSHPEALAHDELLRAKAPYLNPTFFLIRAAVYLIAWSLLALLIVRHSDALDRDPDNAAVADRLKRICAFGLVAYFITMTFAGIDWLMSRDPHWYSTIYGFILCAGQAQVAMATAILVLVGLSLRGQSHPRPLTALLRPRHFNDLGNLLFTTVILFAYLSFAQFLIIWIGNKQEEIPWYVQRTQGVWGAISIALIVLQFFVPFFLLLSRYNKQNLRIIGGIAALLVVMHLVVVFWWVAPSGAHAAGNGAETNAAADHPAFSFYWTDVAAPLGIGGIWLAAYLWRLRRRPLLPRHHVPLAEPLHGAHEPDQQAHEAPGSVG